MSFEQFEEGKDTESMVARPTRYESLFHLLLLVVFFVGSMLLLGGLGAYISSYLLYGDASGLQDAAGLVSDLKAYPFYLKGFIAFSSSLPLLAAALLACIFIKASVPMYLSLVKPNDMKWVALSVLFVFVCLPLMGFMLQLNELVDFSTWPEMYKWLMTQETANNDMYEALIGPKTVWSVVTSFIVMALLPALVEEIFFRGFIMNALNGLFKNMHIAILVTAVVFSIIHLQFMKAIPMFFLATVFGYAAYWTGSIWTSIFAHFINNSMAVFSLYFFTDGDYAKSLEQGQSLGLLANLVLVLVAAGLFIYIQKNASPKTQNFYV